MNSKDMSNIAYKANIKAYLDYHEAFSSSLIDLSGGNQRIN